MNQAVTQHVTSLFSDFDNVSALPIAPGSGPFPNSASLGSNVAAIHSIHPTSSRRDDADQLATMFFNGEGSAASRKLDTSLVSPSTDAVETGRNVNDWALFFLDKLDPTFQQRLLESHWTDYNSVLPIVDKQTFLEAERTKSKELYSTFLHLCVLTTGQSLMSESSLRSSEAYFPHENSSNLALDLCLQCRLLFEPELSGVATLATAQGVLLLAVLEMSQNRDRLSRMLVGKRATE